MAQPLHQSGRSAQTGFTLVELIMVIVLMGVIGGMVSVFMKSPIDAYFASARRATLTDTADTVVRRMARDIHKALPNSIRMPPAGNSCIEFIPTTTGARYRTIGSGALDFAGTTAATTFNMLGDQPIAANDLIVVYNLGIPGADAYELSNTAVVSSAPSVAVLSPPETAIPITYSGGLTHFPLESGSSRFHVVPANEQVVSLVFVAGASSAAGDATGILYRWARPALGAAYATPASCAALQTAMMADLSHPPSILSSNVNTWSVAYDAADQRNAIVRISLGLTVSNETVSLYHEVHVDNTP
ncbi:MAG: prepilin-type N-terminal cleavage/methylation domain-containing protein [Rhodoferax sp.]|nr:prepilin-type N-terminal cleavage/methylation domain-containing protein [Rhodoferax sp.]